MLTPLNTTLRVANSEAVSLSVGNESAASVKLASHDGGVQALPLVDGEFEFPIMEAPDLVKITWLDADGGQLATSYAEVVSCHYFGLSELRNYGGGADDFETLPTETLYMARQAATEVFEQNSRRSFVHRIGRTKDYGRSGFINLLHNDVYELLSDGYVLVSDNQVEPDTQAEPQPYPRWIEYLYGADEVPAQVSRAVLELAAYMLRPSNRPIGATSESTDAGYIHFTTAGRDGATDIPEVNATIEQFGRAVCPVW